MSATAANMNKGPDGPKRSSAKSVGKRGGDGKSTEGSAQSLRARESAAKGSDMLTPDDVAEEIHPLHYAAAMGDKKALGLVLQNKVKEGKDTVFTRDAFGRTALIYAVVGGKQACAEMLIKGGADVNAVDNEGRSPLHWASFHQQFKMVKLLLASGSDPFRVDNESRLCLHLCVGNATTKTFALLAKAMGSKLDVNQRDKWGMTPLHWAAYHASADHVKLLLKAGANSLLADNEGKTPFHWATSSDSVDVARMILTSAGGRVELLNAADHDGRTPLHLAVANGDLRMVHFLVLAGADVCIQDAHLRTALHWAAHGGHAAVIARLLQVQTEQYYKLDSAQSSALVYAAVEGHTACIDTLLAVPEVRDIPDSVGRTALMACASKGDATGLASLLAHVKKGKVSLSAADQAGTTALHMCSFYGFAKLAEMLLRAGAEPNVVDGQGFSPMFYACEMGHAAVVALLHTHRARMDFVDEEGRTYLHWATAGSHTAVCEYILKSGAIAVDIADGGGRTALHTASYLGNPDLVRLLIASGANSNIRDKMGISALHWAASTGSYDCVHLLVVEGSAFPNHMEHHPARLTPLDYAVMAQQMEIANFLRTQGGLTIAEVKDIAATNVQSWWKGFRVRSELGAVWQQCYGTQQGASKREDLSLPPLKQRQSSKTKKNVTLADVMYKPTISRQVMKDVLRAHKTKVVSESDRRVSQADADDSTAPALGPARAPSPLDPAAVPLPSSRSSTPRQPSRPNTPRDAQLAAPTASLEPQLSPRAAAVSRATRELRQQETRRVEEIRSKINAARMIQSAWRKHRSRSGRTTNPRPSGPSTTTGSPPHRSADEHSQAAAALSPHPPRQTPAPPMLPPALARPPIPLRPRVPQAFGHIDPSNPKHQIAALTIQLAWRRYVRRLAVRARAHRGLALLLARRARRHIQQQQAYKAMPMVEQWRPVLAPVVRPAEFVMPTPAITSFNMAFDTYLTPLLHPLQRSEQRRQRVEEISRRAQAVRDQILSFRHLHNEGDDEAASPVVGGLAGLSLDGGRAQAVPV